MERQTQRWKQLKDEASRIEEGITKPNVGKNEKLVLVLEYLIWAMEHFPDQKDPRQDPTGSPEGPCPGGRSPGRRDPPGEGGLPGHGLRGRSTVWPASGDPGPPPRLLRTTNMQVLA